MDILEHLAILLALLLNCKHILKKNKTTKFTLTQCILVKVIYLQTKTKFLAVNYKIIPRDFC